MKKLDLSQIDSPVARENFRKLDEEIQASPFHNGQWQLFDIRFGASGTYRVAHQLGFIPLDILVTHDTAGFAYDHEDFTSDQITVTIAGEGRVRFLLGRMN
jgi:hypothetical protein